MSSTPELAAALVALRNIAGRPAPASEPDPAMAGESDSAEPARQPPLVDARTSKPPLQRQKSVESRSIRLRPGSVANSL
jgi:hypothetical protein